MTRGFVADFGVIFIYISARVFDYDIIGYTSVNILARGFIISFAVIDTFTINWSEGDLHLRHL